MSIDHLLGHYLHYMYVVTLQHCRQSLLTTTIVCTACAHAHTNSSSINSSDETFGSKEKCMPQTVIQVTRSQKCLSLFLQFTSSLNDSRSNQTSRPPVL